MNRHHMILGLVAALSIAASARAQDQTPVREIEIVVEGAYKPQRVEVREGEHVRLRFIRKDYGPCTREVLFPKLNIKRELPTGQPVTIELHSLTPGEYEFRCGMTMIKGLLVVAPASSK